MSAIVPREPSLGNLLFKDEVLGEMSQWLIARTLTSEIYDFMNVMSGSLKVTAVCGGGYHCRIYFGSDIGGVDPPFDYLEYTRNSIARLSWLRSLVRMRVGVRAVSCGVVEASTMTGGEDLVGSLLTLTRGNSRRNMS